MTVFPSFSASYVPPPTQTQFAMLNIGGGGYETGLSAANVAGETRILLRGDEAGAFLYRSSTDRWRCITTYPGISNLKAGNGGNPFEIVFGPNSRAYMCLNTLPSVRGASVYASPKYAVYRSDDAGETWTITSLTAVSGSWSTIRSKFGGPYMAVDPNNEDICYIMGYSGAVYVTYNGGDDWHRVEALLDALPSCVATANNVGGGGGGLTVDSNPIAGAPETHWAAYNETAELSLGTNSDWDTVANTGTSTTVTINGIIQGRNGETGGGFPDGVLIGDVIRFGRCGCVVIDGASGTVANPGIGLGDTGASGVASNNIFFGWALGADHMWWTQNGNPEAAVEMASGPVNIGGGGINGKVHISNDSALCGGGDNVLYVVDNDTVAWRFVATPPTGSGLSANTWTDISQSSPTAPCAIAPDPFTAGRIVYCSFRTHLQISLDYGDTVYASDNEGNIAADATGDQTWLEAAMDYFGADAVFDPNIENKLWASSGVGVWYTTLPTAAGSFDLTWNCKSRGMDSLIPVKTLKAPAPNGRILIASQDRPLMSVPSKTDPPVTYHPIGGIDHGVDITYSDSDPTVCWGGDNAGVWRSTDSGVSWGASKVLTTGDWGSLASTDPLNCVYVPYWPLASRPIKYTDDGGATWNNSQYNGSDMTGYGSTPYSKFFPICTDGNGVYYYYDGSTVGPEGEKSLFKSADGGATFTLVANVDLSSPSGDNGPGSVLVCVPGHTTHLYYAPGGTTNGTFDDSRVLKRSLDSGATWATVSGIEFATSIAFGMAKPGNSYPAAFLNGRITGGENGIYRCDDITAVTPEWTFLSGLKEVTGDGPVFISADMDEYGAVYGSTGGAGAWYGELA